MDAQLNLFVYKLFMRGAKTPGFRQRSVFDTIIITFIDRKIGSCQQTPSCWSNHFLRGNPPA